MRKILRVVVLWIFVGFLLATLVGMLSEFFIELVREWGWYDDPSRKVDSVMTAFRIFVTHPYFIGTAVFVAGLCLGLWIDWLLRRWEQPAQSAPLPDIATLAPQVERLLDALAKDSEQQRKEGRAVVNSRSFHEFNALQIKLMGLEIDTPLSFDARGFRHDAFTDAAYGYLCAIAPYVRDNDTAGARDNANLHLLIRQKVEGANPVQSDERQAPLASATETPR